ncbi:4Fe-4S binding protein [Candidatus Solincola tengchongensis]|uniref:4Fe-4S binding protein n=1 Tax=Candidatus Solincola tengchongensis TaxID=2900693 RepID=UPI00257AB43C|nr:4Fe-4S binding protein [Candidatus Solincola tengchongensis]
MGYPKGVVKGFLSLWPFTHLVKKLSPYPPFRRLFAPLVDEKVLQVTFLPVSEDIPLPESTVLPRQALAELIRASSHRFIHDGCICRNREGCSKYPRDIGCIFLGEAAAHLHPSLGHRASVEECLAHVERAARAGLTGMIGRIWFDAASLGVLREFKRFLVVCFCCDCCCLVRTDMRHAAPEFKRAIRRLDSVRVRVGERCAGCGTCVEACFVGAVELRGGRAFIDPEKCKGCGRCSLLCSNRAVEVEFDPSEELFRELLRRAGAVAGGEGVEEDGGGARR